MNCISPDYNYFWNLLTTNISGPLFVLCLGLYVTIRNRLFDFDRGGAALRYLEEVTIFSESFNLLFWRYPASWRDRITHDVLTRRATRIQAAARGMIARNGTHATDTPDTLNSQHTSESPP